MIPFGSQRALGQDLATHLMNERDNEYMEVADVRGAVARDLHGAFAEWEAVAHGLTRCRNYLYSLSVNPDPGQGPLTREQYLDYVTRVEERLGLADQPRAVVFHIKNGREHCHVVWSRVDAEKGKAVQIAFDREKLMMVTRQFARDHGLSLPEGYFRDKGDRDKGGRERSGRGKSGPQTLYERAQQSATGLSKEERMARITRAWRSSDSPKAFVRALEDLGYVLATGNRPYVLVDVYGQINALPKLIDDKSVRTKDLRAFLGRDFPPESLPSVDEAKQLVARHRKAIEDFQKARVKSDQIDRLKAAQKERRDALEREAAALKAAQAQERRRCETGQKDERSRLRAAHLAEMTRRRTERAQTRPRGLAAFLGRVSGVALITGKLRKYRDHKLIEAFRARRAEMKDRQHQERAILQRRQEMQALDLARKVRALDQIEQRERRSLDTALLKEERTRERARHGHQMPAMHLKLTPKGRTAAPHKAMNRYTSELARELAEVARARRQGAEKPAPEPIDLTNDFTRAAKREETGRGSGDESGAPKPQERDRAPREAKRRVVTDVTVQGDFEQATTHGQRYAGDDTGSADGPAPSVTPTSKPPRPRRPRTRKKNKDFYHDR